MFLFQDVQPTKMGFEQNLWVSLWPSLIQRIFFPTLGQCLKRKREHMIKIKSQSPDNGQEVDDAAHPDHLDAVVPQLLQPLPQHLLPPVPHTKDQLVHHVAHLRKISSKKTPSLYHSIKSYNVQWPMSQVATCYRRGVTCDSSWVTCDCSWVTCDSFSVSCGHLWHRSLNIIRFHILWYNEGVFLP